MGKGEEAGHREKREKKVSWLERSGMNWARSPKTLLAQGDLLAPQPLVGR